MTMTAGMGDGGESCLDGVNICCIADEMHVSEFSSSTLRRWRCGVST